MEEGKGWAGLGYRGQGIGRVVPQEEEQDGGCSSLHVTGGRVEQQCRTDFCVPKYTRDSFNPNHFGGELICGRQVVEIIERGGINPRGCGLRSGAGLGDFGLGFTHAWGNEGGVEVRETSGGRNRPWLFVTSCQHSSVGYLARTLQMVFSSECIRSSRIIASSC